MMRMADRVGSIQYYRYGGDSQDEDTTAPPRVRRLFPETWLWESSKIGYAEKLQNMTLYMSTTASMKYSWYLVYNFFIAEFKRYKLID